jgi:hypothetical protein
MPQKEILKKAMGFMTSSNAFKMLKAIRWLLVTTPK